MTRIAVSGHCGLPPATVGLVEAALRADLAPHAHDLVGLTCLADGADQIFARVVLDLGGTFEIVVPAVLYRDSLPASQHAAYDALFAKASVVRRLDFVESTSESHMAASVDMLADADHLIAVWDGLPSRGYGGTADVVDHARQQGIPVTVIWPSGSSRD
ncbi:MAG: hypothetical protein HKP61_16850 [Dactylosporangium sp.]|nr:hypothetical protein [Dactylosporangium sp.]NNJ62576.1 hypothetical protein [Dactylosporangium sp.]